MGFKGKKRELSVYERLVEGSSEEKEEKQAPRGFIPVIVGKEPRVKRFLVHVKLFKDPCMVVLLEMAENELGHKQDGALRILCDVDHFQQVVNVISKSK
ncbi:Small auxin-up RNA protein [Dioscorea alata]|uniref:Small auxin-up RNA protein n=1 Tax=Dioscorea alata TaxID=55571 RepID=A0ACB7VHX1_DIOAL|nr:Small auxin-up RNA protein [Dioscorea alata]